jgi:hypothetical protein
MVLRTPLICAEITNDGKPIEDRASVRTFLERGRSVGARVQDAVMTAVVPTAGIRNIVDNPVDGDVGRCAVLTVEHCQLG